MPDWPIYLGFLGISAVLIVTPGPNVMMVVANGLAYGTRRGLCTVAGTATAMALQLVLIAVGTASLLAVLAEGFAWLRWLGVAYLVYAGIKVWRAEPRGEASINTTPRSAAKAFVQGFAVSLTNPKTLLFFAAFLPQFVTPGPGAAMGLAVLASSFWGLATLLDSGYALLAGTVGRRADRWGRSRCPQRVSGGMLVLAGVGLALMRRP